MIPTVHTHPVKRPTYPEQASWLGEDDDLALQCSYRDIAGTLKTISFQTRNSDEGTPGEICIPNSSDVADLGPNVRDILVAHLRMAVLIQGRAIPGSKEFSESLINQLLANNLQTAVGDVKITDHSIVDDQCVDVEFRQGNGTKRVYTINYNELATYTFVPSTQLLIIPGAIRKKFGTSYVHDYPNDALTSTQKQNIIDYLISNDPDPNVGFSPWI